MTNEKEAQSNSGSSPITVKEMIKRLQAFFDEATNIKDPTVRAGQWASECCYKSLFEIETEEKAKEIQDRNLKDEKNDNFPTYDIWNTELEALTDMRSLGFDPNESAGIDRRIAILREKEAQK